MFRPSDYYQCESMEDIHENNSQSCQVRVRRARESNWLCLKKRNGRRFGGERYADVGFASIVCHVYSGIECFGNRTFVKEEVPCLKYSSHHFLSTLFYSIFLGLFAVDRYSLGHIGIAVGKMITLGGLGLWWIIDIILLIFGKLMPADDSNWIVQHWAPCLSLHFWRDSFRKYWISFNLCIQYLSKWELSTVHDRCSEFSCIFFSKIS